MKQKTYELTQEIECLSSRLESLQNYHNQVAKLRQVENLTEKNYALFLARNRNDLCQHQGAFYFPCASTVLAKARQSSTFSRQVG